MSAEITQVGDFIVTVQPDGDAFIAEIAYPNKRMIEFGYARAYAFYTMRFSTPDAARDDAKAIISSGKIK